MKCLPNGITENINNVVSSFPRATAMNNNLTPLRWIAPSDLGILCANCLFRFPFPLLASVKPISLRYNIDGDPSEETINRYLPPCDGRLVLPSSRVV